MSSQHMDQAGHYVAPGDLRVGLYIHVDLPWFSHPFTLSAFKISSQEQIRELRGLDVTSFRYDPERSEAQATAALPAAGEAPQRASAAGTDADAGAVAPAPDPRAAQLHAHREAAARMEKSFLKAVGIVRKLDKTILSRPRQALGEMVGLVEQMVTVFLDRPEVTLQVMGSSCGGEEAYHHGLNVSILSMMLVKGLNLSAERARLLGIGALLHDIGLVRIPSRVLRKPPEEYTRAERDLRARHVEYGVQIGRRLGLRLDALAIIEQHHEFGDGSGYPAGLRLDEIAPLARIVALVNFYESLCNPVDCSHALTPHEALAAIFAHRRSQFDAQILQLLIRSLGVYPPGSVVKLSNDALGMVISVNPHKSLRPWVLLYNAAIPKEEAVVLNLETESELSISKVIRPALLPPPIYAYLSPRKRITYFFDGGLRSDADHK